ncbi:hypothetical protein FBU59_007270 [Linderina macrospora]|uniref:Uncharacterized protein n=1 Tax=Linderina macrospora TaxID=4868 RepID=A0ACC1IXJ4_9FUNG|nr:hypothetical protein FBU59_007270 [Linderina macrospora]
MSITIPVVSPPRGIECLACTRMFGCLEDVVEHISSNSCPFQPQLPANNQNPQEQQRQQEMLQSDAASDAPSSPSACDVMLGDIDVDAIVSKLNSEQVELFMSLLGDNL